jgi:hypothetical protein
MGRSSFLDFLFVFFVKGWSNRCRFDSRETIALSLTAQLLIHKEENGLQTGDKHS